MIRFFETVVFFLVTSSLVSSKMKNLQALDKYVLNWDGGLKPCEGADNSVFDLSQLVVQKKTKTLIAMVGDVTLTRDSADAVKIVLTIDKEVNGEYEYLMTVQEENLCKHIAEKNKPWTPFVNDMGITGCPVLKKVYTFKGASLDTAGFPMAATEVGKYRAKIEMFEDGKRSGCFLADVSIQPM